ncbi:hypothetical protein GCM10009021_27060 [Halarchaeum nitratireducens]|uniref:Uncharacterized protein n=1 Tax=Halarchaeum nitratireducens TaxID=489913 RepID=A0A830GDL5_9EURY|nr:hypothetical protein GCM10009021_27060 [Halarchaeum nitratireducens]
MSITTQQTEHDEYPSRRDYSLHFGEVGGDTILRYDNAHERTKGHERHIRDDVEYIDFPGMLELYERFAREVDEQSSTSWDWSLE